MTRTARCCCQQLTITVNAEPVLQGICHCEDCKKRTGSAFAWSAYFRPQNVDKTEGEFYTYVVNSDNPQKRHFCNNCGSTLFWESSAFDGLIGIAAGNFTDVPLAEPGLTLSNTSKCPWLSIPDDWMTSIN